MQRLLEIMRTLRAPDGCPWDRQQTHQSLRPYLLEEAAETVDAISSGQLEELPGELGDVLLQVAFHSVIAEEGGTFGYAEVERAIVEKLIRRHPHVFGTAQAETADEVVTNWNAIKALERGGQEKHPLERIPAALGALERERQTQKVLGVDRLERPALLEVVHNTSDDAAGLAAVLGAVVAWARSLDLDPELILREKTARAIQAGLLPRAQP